MPQGAEPEEPTNARPNVRTSEREQPVTSVTGEQDEGMKRHLSEDLLLGQTQANTLVFILYCHDLFSRSQSFIMADGGTGTKLVVLGLPYATTEETLNTYFSQHGTVTDCAIMKDKQTGRSRGFGFVVFAAKEDAERMISMEHEIDGRRAEAKIALPKSETLPAGGPGGATAAAPGGGGTTRIFVARIPPSVTDDEFRTHFEKFGVIEDAYMPKEHVSREPRGIGFITFGSPDAVDRVMAETHTLGNQTVAVDRATPKVWPAPYSH
ncbi:hypothetical protein CYMTET_14467 [Cymbomonas tetramitiformis]|uniref:RRM domain-containing protein n=1 Tax=Cymbomonas tetramitiformis TaxID=36881 RepID=A0AAE0L9Z7_9CHLO|nr:hypothetical protein CYMTET_14467 [Cymbomonas tetramitiformis]